MIFNQSHGPSQTRMSKSAAGESLQMSYTKNVQGQFNEWPAQVLQSLYEAHPYLADYQPSIEINKINPEKGYLTGKALLQIGERSATIPLIVKAFEILPFAVFLSDDEAFPLNEGRIATALQALEPAQWQQDSQKEWENVVQDQNLDPPDHFYGGVMGNRAVLNKMSGEEKVDPIMKKILDRAEESGRDAAKGLAADIEKKSALENLSAVREEDLNSLFSEASHFPAVEGRLNQLAKTIEKGAARVDMAQAYGPHQDTFLIEPTGPQRFHLTGTSARFRKMSSADCTRAQAVGLFGAETVRKATKEGYAIAKEAAAAQEAPPQEAPPEQGLAGLIPPPGLGAPRSSILAGGLVTPTAGFEVPVKAGDRVGSVVKGASIVELSSENPQPIKDTGMWGVRDKMGNPHNGAVFCKVYNFGDRFPLPLKVFFNGTIAAVQEDITGIPIGPIANFPEIDEPEGECVFVFEDPIVPGEMCCTVPFAVSDQTNTQFGPGYVIETYLAQRLIIISQPVQYPMQVEGDIWAMPESYKMVKMAEPDSRTALLESPEQWDSMVKGAHKIEVLSDRSGSYGIRGAGYNLQDIEKRSAELILTSLGAKEAQKLLKKADFVGKVQLWGDLPEDGSGALSASLDTLVKHAEAVTMNLRFDHRKLASMVDKLLKYPYMGEKLGAIDPDTVDDVLSLGFVRPENTRMFLESEPTLERSVRQLARLTLASQLGYSQIPTREAIDGMEAMEAVLEALRKIKADTQGPIF